MDIKVIACVVLVLVSMSDVNGMVKRSAYGAGGGSFASASASANSNAGAGPFGGFGPFSSPFISGRFGGNDISGFPPFIDNGYQNDWLNRVQKQNQEWLERVQAQNQAANQQFQEQIKRNQASGSWAIGSASISDFEPVSPDTQIFTRTRVTYPYMVMGTPFPGSSVNQPQSPFSLDSRFNNYNGLDNGNQFESRNGFGTGGSSGGSSGGTWAWGSANAGPQGNNQAGAFGPANPGIESRFAEDTPSSGGNSYSSFSSSSSSSHLGPDGKVISRKEVITGTNDNGKVSVKAIRDP